MNNMKKYKPLLILLLLALLGRMSLFSADAADAQLSATEAPIAVVDSGAAQQDDSGPQPEPSPQPSGCNGSLVMLDGTVDATSGRNNSPVRFGTAPDLRWFYSVPDLSFEAGTVSLPQVITWDAYTGREHTEVQPSERVRIEFFLGGEHVASSPFTPDLADGVTTASAVTDLGTMDLPNGADEVRIVHYDWVTTTTTENSLVVTAICLEATAASSADAQPTPEPPAPEAAEPACDDNPETPEPADGCPSEEPPSCDGDTPAEGCAEAVCDDNPATPDPEGGCTPTPVCDDNPATPEPAEGCGDEVPEDEDEDLTPVPEPGAGDGDQAPELAVTGSTTENLVAVALILLILGIAFDGAIARGLNRFRSIGNVS